MMFFFPHFSVERTWWMVTFSKKVTMASTMRTRCLLLLIIFSLGNMVLPTKNTVTPNASTTSNNSTLPLEFFPKTTLDIVDCPALIPCLKSFTVKNIHTDMEVLISSVTSNSTNVHVVTFQSSLLVPADEIMIQILFLPYLEDTIVSSRLVLETSLGLVEYVVMGHSIANPYKLRPFLGSRLTAGTESFDQPILIHNPFEEPLQIREVFTTEDFMSLKGMPSLLSTKEGEQDLSSGGTMTTSQSVTSAAGQSVWTIGPGADREIITLCMLASNTTGSFSGYVHIKTSRDNMVIPVELTVVVSLPASPSVVMTASAVSTSNNSHSSVNLSSNSTNASTTTISSTSSSSRVRTKRESTHKHNQRRSAFDDDDHVDDDVVEETPAAAVIPDESSPVLDSVSSSDDGSDHSSSSPSGNVPHAALNDSDPLPCSRPDLSWMDYLPCLLITNRRLHHLWIGWMVGCVMLVIWLGRSVVFPLFVATQRPVPKRSRHGHRQKNKTEKMMPKTVEEEMVVRDTAADETTVSSSISTTVDKDLDMVASPVTDTSTTTTTTTSTDTTADILSPEKETILPESLLSSDQVIVEPLVSLGSTTSSVIAPPSSSPHRPTHEMSSSQLISPPRTTDLDPISVVGSPCLGGMDIIERTILADLAWASSSSTSKSQPPPPPLSQSLFAMSPLDDDDHRMMMLSSPPHDHHHHHHHHHHPHPALTTSFTLPWLSSHENTMTTATTNLPLSPLGGGWSDLGGYGQEGMPSQQTMIMLGGGVESEGFDVDLTVDLDTSQDYEYHPPSLPPVVMVNYDSCSTATTHHGNQGGVTLGDMGGGGGGGGISVQSGIKGRPSYPPGLVRRGK